ncbi:hypothetical protein EZS27_013445 [termite gut metagenome]|uniref:Uncharacterized protein n=1 Tax=termite gut metagenome TaxID=433724 RepID=A0A5J4RY88_9ZZZZ
MGQQKYIFLIILRQGLFFLIADVRYKLESVVHFLVFIDCLYVIVYFQHYTNFVSMEIQPIYE